MGDGRSIDLELFKFDSCPYCHVVYRAIDRLGVNVRLRDTMFEPEAARTLLQVGGKQQVPCLFIDGRPMYESLDIVAWLEENF